MVGENTERQDNAPDQTADGTTEQFKKDFNRKVNNAVQKWPNQDFGPAFDEVTKFATDALKNLVKGKSYAPVLNVIIDFVGGIVDGALKFGTEALQKFLAKKIHKTIDNDPELAKNTSKEDKQRIEKLDNKLNPEEKGQEHSVKSPETKNIADHMRQNFQQPKHSTGVGDHPPMAQAVVNQNKGAAR